MSVKLFSPWESPDATKCDSWVSVRMEVGLYRLEKEPVLGAILCDLHENITC